MKQTKLEKPKRWDKKWRILIFDIPEAKKNQRDQIRWKLSSLGFVRLQNSVWIYPHDCEEFMTLLKADLKVGRDLLYVVADALENDDWLRSRFNLS